MKFIVSILVFFLACVCQARDFEEGVQINFKADSETWGVGGRFHTRSDVSQAILRYRPAKNWLGQIRYVNRSETSQYEHWLRLQHKSFSTGWFSFYSVAEYRERGQKSNNFRFRPKLLFKASFLEKHTIYYRLTPHWIHDFDDDEAEFRFSSHKYGFIWSYSRNSKIGTFFKTRLDSNWAKPSTLFGMDFNLRL